MRSLNTLILVIFLLTSCAGKSTPQPLTSKDMSSIMVQPGDLPKGFSYSEVKNKLPAMFGDIVQPVGQFYQEFTLNEEPAGGAAVIIYDTSLNAISSFTTLVNGMGETVSVDSFGDRARLASIDYSAQGGAVLMDLLFLRCTTVVHIRLVGTTNQDDLIPFAQRMDERLAKLLCPKS